MTLGVGLQGNLVKLVLENLDKRNNAFTGYKSQCSSGRAWDRKGSMKYAGGMPCLCAA